MEKFGRTTQATDDNKMWHKKDLIWMVDD